MSYLHYSAKDIKKAIRRLYRALPKSKARAIRRYDRALAQSRIQDPGKKHSDYYGEVVSKRLRAGIAHPTLGANLRDGEGFEESGHTELNRLVDGGLLPEHVCVDYGCGSLRIGQHLMRYLNPFRYWGLDVTDRFFQIGLDLVGPELINEKRPNLHVIDPTVLAQVQAAEPDFIVCNAVVIHVPPEEIDEFFQNIIGLLCPQTTAFINVQLSQSLLRTSPRSWAYPEAYLTRQVENLGGHVCDFQKGKPRRKNSWRRNVCTAWMIITSRSASRTLPHDPLNSGSMIS